ncbi:MAG: hypothetical protein ACI9S9_003822 [Planctomycetota bacterium]
MSAAFTGQLLSPRIVNCNVHYANGGTTYPDFARTEVIGTGCVEAFASIYELATVDVFAATNTLFGLDFTSTVGGYLVTAASSGVQPVNLLDPTAVPVVGVSDDTVVPIGTIGLEFGSNGWIAMGSGNSFFWIPMPALLLDQPAAQFSFWSDWQPNVGGTITCEEVGKQMLLTYDRVLACGTKDLNLFQFAYDSATGNCSLYFGAMASATAHPMMIGHSPGGPNADPGSIGIEAEFAANGAIVKCATDTLPLTLESVGRPVTGPDWNMTTSNIAPTAIAHFGFLGSANPALPLSIIGMPADCTLYALPVVIVTPIDPTLGATSWSWTALPNVPVCCSCVLFAQAATIGPGPGFTGWRVSNGIKGTIGDL